MGNTKTSHCMPMCGEKDEQTSQRNNRKYAKGNKKDDSRKFKAAKNNLKQILEEEAHQRYQDVKVIVST